MTYDAATDDDPGPWLYDHEALDELHRCLVCRAPVPHHLLADHDACHATEGLHLFRPYYELAADEFTVGIAEWERLYNHPAFDDRTDL